MHQRPKLREERDNVIYRFGGAAAIFPFVNGRCHLEQSWPFLKQSLPFITVVAISIHASSDKNVTSSRK